MAKNHFTPLQTGKLCPIKSNEWEDLKRKWNCPDPEFYHCIPNQYNVPGEICVKPNWASKSKNYALEYYCPIFNTAANDIDLIPCDLRYGACSDTDYRFNKVYLYPGCLNKTSVSTITPGTDESPLRVSLPVIIIPVLVVVILLTIGIICLIKRNKRKGTSETIKHREIQPLRDIKAIPIEFRRSINYLNADVFVPTEMYKRAVGMLETQGWITLIGPPGSGKTMTAIQLAKRKLGCSGSAQGRKCSFYFCKSLSEISGLSNDKTEPYIILDDFMEQYRYYPSKLSEDKALFDSIFQEFLHNGLVHVIFTIKEDTWKNFSKNALHAEIFNSNTHLNLVEKPLTEKEKISILRNHLRINKINVTTNKKEEKVSLQRGKDASLDVKIIPDSGTELNDESEIIIHKDILQKIAAGLKDDSTFSVPVIIDFMCVNRNLLRNHSHILSKTFRKTLKRYVKDWIESEKDEDKKSICAVLFAGLCGGVVSIDDFYSNAKGQIYVNVCKKYKVEPCNPPDIENLMRKNARVRGFLYSESDICSAFTFHHDSLLDFFLVYACAEDDEKFFIENANIDYMLRRCNLSEKTLIDIVAEKIGHPQESVELEVIDKLVDRILEEIRQGYTIPHWESHIFWNHETFKDKWNKMSKFDSERRPSYGGQRR